MCHVWRFSVVTFSYSLIFQILVGVILMCLFCCEVRTHAQTRSRFWRVIVCLVSFALALAIAVFGGRDGSVLSALISTNTSANASGLEALYGSVLPSSTFSAGKISIAWVRIQSETAAHVFPGSLRLLCFDLLLSYGCNFIL